MAQKRIVSLSLPRFATDLLARGGGWDNTRPLATVAARDGRRALVAVNAVAETVGLFPGQGLADARALCPELAVARADGAGAARALAALAEWCTRYTPWTAPDYFTVTGAGGDPGVWLDITGCAHLFARDDGDDGNGESALLTDLANRLAGAGLAARAAIADTPGTAWALARFGLDNTVVARPGRHRAALAPLPVAALRLPPATVATLDQLGLRRIGDLYGLPRAGIEARFGSADAGQVQKRLDQALGLRAEPISPHNCRLGRPAPSWRARLALPEPVNRAADVIAGIDRLLAELCPRFAREGHGARRLELTLFRTDASLRRTAIGTSQPSHDPAHLARLFAERLTEAGDIDDAGDGADIELMILEATATEPLVPVQLTFARRDGTIAAAMETNVGPLIDRLAARLGAARVVRLAPRASHLPECAVVRRPAFEAETNVHATNGAEQHGTQNSWRRWAGPPDRFPAHMRPIRLLARPEPVRVVASARGAPARFDWRRANHDVARAEGPERLAPEWWRQDGARISGGPPRDYYRVEDSDGGRFWLFRAGGDWFLHGLFA